jgi:hypothetical protein
VAPGEGALSARTVLEVADGLCWSDPRLGRSLAEHALRLAGDDAAARAAAQRCVIRSLAEVDGFEEIVSRATPLLEDASVRQDRDDLAALLVELAAASIGFGDDVVATRLVAPVGPGQDLPTGTTVHAALVRAQLAGATGDVAGADLAAQDADAALRETAEPEAGLARRDLARARAAARSRGGDPASALSIVSGVVSADPGADPDGGRRSLLATADQVDLLLDLGRPDEALERGRAALPADAAPPMVRPASRIRLALAERVHLSRGAHDEARSLARTAAEQLEDAGHDAAAARAWEVVASAAERGGDLGAALTAVRHGHALESRSRDRRDPALRALATLAASAPELPARPGPPPPVAPEPAAPEPAPARAPLSEVESLLADVRSSMSEAPVDGSGSPARRRGHRRQDGDASRAGTESVPETLARLLGGSGAEPRPLVGTTTSPAYGDGDAAGRSGADDHDESGLPEEGIDSSAWSARRGRPGGGVDQPAEPPLAETDTGAPPAIDAFSTAPGSRTDHPVDSDRFVSGPESASRGAASAADRWDPAEFPDIDPADPLGSIAPGEAPGHPVDGAPALELGSSTQELPGSGQGRLETSRTDARGAAFSHGIAPGSPAPWRQERDVPGPPAARSTPPLGPPPASRYEPAGSDREELDEELALTLAGLLAEYGPPEVPRPPRQDDARPPDVPVPSARRHVSGSMPLPATDQRFAARPADAPDRAATAPDGGAVGGRAPRGENGARLANLLAEAMDAFRHTGPDEQGPVPADPVRGSGDPASSNGDRRRADPAEEPADGPRRPGIGTRRG